MSDSRVFFLTYYKCGSQWVRDVLTSPEALERSGGLRFHSGGLDPTREELPDFPRGTLTGPIYGLSFQGWERLAREGDRAVVVLRDPRDLVVSWMYSATYSHVESDLFARFREPLLRMDSTQRLLLFAAGFDRFERSFRSWAGRASSEREWVTSYERLLSDQGGEFARIFDFLGWDVPSEVVERIVERHSFERRSGRKRGEERLHSHFRRAEPGDWKRHFDSLSGLYFERVAPGLVAELGYDSDPEWYARLDSPATGADAEPVVEDRREWHRLQARVARLEEENRTLSQACQERLELIERLTGSGEAPSAPPGEED